MSATTPASPAAFPRRAFLAGSAAGVAVLVAGCTSTGNGIAAVTAQQVDQLAGQVTVQESLVAAFATAVQADPALGAKVADLATQVRQQLDRLKAAAPGPTVSASTSTASASPAPPAGPDARAWLRTQVATAADSHATACLDQTGPRAALLGSIAAGLRGQDGRLA